ncbi:hypothetical protein [Candidatus Hodarchaeum mangrovi]
MTDLKFIGRILGAVGGLIMIILGIVELIEAVDLLQFNLQLFDFNIISGAVQGNLVVIAIVTIICGTIAIYGYKALSNKGKGDQVNPLLPTPDSLLHLFHPFNEFISSVLTVCL